eukprot:9146828-Pyramimonas_sp.AAC.1
MSSSSRSGTGLSAALGSALPSDSPLSPSRTNAGSDPASAASTLPGLSGAAGPAVAEAVASESAAAAAVSPPAPGADCR